MIAGECEFVAGVNRMETIGQGDAVAFFVLTRKFVDNEASIPEDACDVLYYTLSVGHHTGVMDCFERALSMPVTVFESIVNRLDESDARRKLEGLLVFGEIEVGKEHAPSLLVALRDLMAHADVYGCGADNAPAVDSEEFKALVDLVDLLVRVRDTRDVYLMARRVAS